MEQKQDLIDFTTPPMSPKPAKIRPALGKSSHVSMDSTCRPSFADLESFMRKTPTPFPSRPIPPKPVKNSAVTPALVNGQCLSPRTNGIQSTPKASSAILSVAKVPYNMGVLTSKPVNGASSPLNLTNGTLEPVRSAPVSPKTVVNGYTVPRENVDVYPITPTRQEDFKESGVAPKLSLDTCHARFLDPNVVKHGFDEPRSGRTGRLSQADIDLLEAELTHRPVEGASISEENQGRIEELYSNLADDDNGKGREDIVLGSTSSQARTVLPVQRLSTNDVGIPPRQRASNELRGDSSVVQISFAAYNTILRDRHLLEAELVQLRKEAIESRNQTATQISAKDQVIKQLMSSFANPSSLEGSKPLSHTGTGILAKVSAEKVQEIAELQKKLYMEGDKRDEQIRSLGDRNATLTALLDDAGKLAKEQRLELDVKQREVEGLKKKEVAHQLKVLANEKELEELKTNKAMHEQEISKLLKSLKELENQMQGTRAHTEATLREKETHSEKGVAEKEQAIMELRTALDTEKTTTTMFSGQLKEMSKEMITVKDHLTQSREESKSKTSEASRLRNELRETAKILDIKQAIVARLTEGDGHSVLKGAAHLVQPSARARLPTRVFACIECYAKNMQCDNKSQCDNCKSANIKCMRFRCSQQQVLKTDCPDGQFCHMKHSREGWLMTEQERPQW